MEFTEDRVFDADQDQPVDWKEAYLKLQNESQVRDLINEIKTRYPSLPEDFVEQGLAAGASIEDIKATGATLHNQYERGVTDTKTKVAAATAAIREELAAKIYVETTQRIGGPPGVPAATTGGKKMSFSEFIEKADSLTGPEAARQLENVQFRPTNVAGQSIKRS